MDRSIAEIREIIKDGDISHSDFFSRNQMKLLYLMLVDIGADQQLTSDNAANRSLLLRMHAMLTIDNNRCPAHLTIDEIYIRFSKWMVENTDFRKGNNAAEILRCFNHWISLPGEASRVTEMVYNNYPHRKPRELPKPQSKNTNLEDWDDRELKATYDNCQEVFETNWGRILQKNDKRRIWHRLQEECTKRGLIQEGQYK